MPNEWCMVCGVILMPILDFVVFFFKLNEIAFIGLVFSIISMPTLCFLCFDRLVKAK